MTELTLAHAGFTNPCRVGLPHLRAPIPGQPTTGWIAISENYYRRRSNLLLCRDPCDLTSVYRPGEISSHPFAWLEAHQPVAIVAGSIRQYHLR